jgi:hypothetical protein
MSGMASIRKAIFRPIYGPIKEKLDKDYSLKRRNERGLKEEVNSLVSKYANGDAAKHSLALKENRGAIVSRLNEYKKEYKDAVENRKKVKQENAQDKTAQKETNRLINALGKKFTRIEAEKTKAINKIQRIAEGANVEEFLNKNKISSRSNSLDNSRIEIDEAIPKLHSGEYHPPIKSFFNDARINENLNNVISNINNGLKSPPKNIHENFMETMIDILLNRPVSESKVSKQLAEERVNLCLDVASAHLFTIRQLLGSNREADDIKYLKKEFDASVRFISKLSEIQEQVSKTDDDEYHRYQDTDNTNIKILLRNCFNSNNFKSSNKNSPINARKIKSNIKNHHDKLVVDQPSFKNSSQRNGRNNGSQDVNNFNFAKSSPVEENRSNPEDIFSQNTYLNYNNQFGDTNSKFVENSDSSNDKKSDSKSSKIMGTQQIKSAFIRENRRATNFSEVGNLGRLHQIEEISERDDNEGNIDDYE